MSIIGSRKLIPHIRYNFSFKLKKGIKPNIGLSLNNKGETIAPSITKSLSQKMQMLNNKIKIFSDNFQHFSNVMKNSDLSNTALFARSCLISNNHISIDEAYSRIKKSINRQNQQLTAHSCTALMQCLSHYKFEGDENKILEKLCNFYENNYHLFSKKEEMVFWESYLFVMGSKAHSTIKFRNLRRQSQQTLPFSTLQQITQQVSKNIKVNAKMIKNISYPKDSQIILTLTKPNVKNFEILFKIKSIDKIKNLLTGKQNDEIGQVSIEKKNYLLDQISGVNGNLKNGWHVFLCGNLLQAQQKKDTFVWKQKPIFETDTYLTSQKISKQTKIIISQLNTWEGRRNLLLHQRYKEGILYNSTHPTKRQIDVMGTLALGAKNFRKSQATLQLVQSKTNFQEIDKYLSISALKQCFAYVNCCKFHWELWEAFVEVQNFISYYKKELKQLKYDINSLRQTMEGNLMTEAQKKNFLLSNSALLSDIIVDESKQIKNLNLHILYNNDYKEEHNFLGSYAKQMYWQMQPSFIDVLKITKRVNELIQNSKDSQGNLKIMVAAYKQDIPSIVKCFLQARFWSVPTFKITNKQQMEARQVLDSQLFRKI